MLVYRSIQGYEKIGSGLRFHGRSPKREFNVATGSKVRLQHLRVSGLIGKWRHQGLTIEKETEGILRHDLELKVQLG
jgi:hypothetical protein